ncbi:MAG: hypothetical protein FWC91_12735 [Defluviitaleaceae bacterium]|nr:hypothetical protein [Defluviitaleaceae bacterium]
MSAIAVISFPKELETPRLSDIINKKIAFDINYVSDIFQEEKFIYSELPIKVNNVIISDIEDMNMNFDNCFKNPFIYDLCISISPNYRYDEKIKIIREDEKDEIINRKLKEIWDEESLFRNQLLYTFLQLTLNVDEFVEIYAELINGEDYNFGSPESECIMDLEELLTCPKSKRRVRKCRYTIYKTKQRDW